MVLFLSGHSQPQSCRLLEQNNQAGRVEGPTRRCLPSSVAKPVATTMNAPTPRVNNCRARKSQPCKLCWRPSHSSSGRSSARAKIMALIANDGLACSLASTSSREELPVGVFFAHDPAESRRPAGGPGTERLPVKRSCWRIFQPRHPALFRRASPRAISCDAHARLRRSAPRTSSSPVSLSPRSPPNQLPRGNKISFLA